MAALAPRGGSRRRRAMNRYFPELLPPLLAQLPARVRQAQDGDAQVPVVISAERNVKYDAVVRVMDVLQREGVQRVGLSVKQSGGTNGGS